MKTRGLRWQPDCSSIGCQGRRAEPERDIEKGVRNEKTRYHCDVPSAGPRIRGVRRRVLFPDGAAAAFEHDAHAGPSADAVLIRRFALARNLRLSPHRRATRPDAALIARLIPRERYAPAARASSLGYFGRCATGAERFQLRGPGRLRARRDRGKTTMRP